jgi:hypothetical protein
MMNQPVLSSQGHIDTMITAPSDPADGNICRICLAAASEKSPCSCSGSSGYVHASCLTQWAVEKRCMVCEICKSPYKEPFRSTIEAQINLLRREEGAPSGQVEGVWSLSVIRAIGSPREPEDRGAVNFVESQAQAVRARWLHCVLWLLGFSCLLGVVLYLAVFSDIQGWHPSSATDWISLSWKIIALLIPTCILLRVAWSYYVRWREERRSRASIQTDRPASRGRPTSPPPEASSQDPLGGLVSSVPTSFTPFGSVVITVQR